MRWVSTRVLPDPAPATTSSGPSRCTTASSWSGFSPSVAASFGGYDYVAHRYAYRQALSHANFSGGRTAEVSWIERASLLGAFAHFGLTGITIGPEEPEHPTGPAITFVATRRGA